MIAGRKKVQGPWKMVAGIATAGNVALRRQIIRVAGGLAIETGIEKGHMTAAGKKLNIEHRVTNIYRREGRSWKVIHHHTDLSPDMVKLVQRLQAKK